MIIYNTTKSGAKVTITIPDEIDSRLKIDKINQIYDILKPNKESVRESA